MLISKTKKFPKNLQKSAQPSNKAQKRPFPFSTTIINNPSSIIHNQSFPPSCVLPLASSPTLHTLPFRQVPHQANSPGLVDDGNSWRPSRILSAAPTHRIRPDRGAGISSRLCREHPSDEPLSVSSVVSVADPFSCLFSVQKC